MEIAALKGYHAADLQEHATKMRVRGTEPPAVAAAMPAAVPVASSPSGAARVEAEQVVLAIATEPHHVAEAPVDDDLLAELEAIEWIRALPQENHHTFSDYSFNKGIGP